MSTTGQNCDTDNMEPSQQSSTPSMASDPDSMLAEERRRLAQYVRDLYDSGAKMYTRDMFRDLDWELAKEPMPDTVMLRSSTLISFPDSFTPHPL